jgi:broad specificity phosphatase PhoE
VAARVLLIRHAQSAWNADGRWQGWADPPLSPAGEADAGDAASNPILGEVSAVVASDLQRARRTAEIIAAPLGAGPVRTFRGLRERGAGVWTGLTRAEIEEGWPGVLGRRDLVIPGGESAEAVTARAVATLHRIASEWDGQTVLGVSHGALIRLVEEYCGEQPVGVRNLAGRWVSISADGLVLGPAVELGPTHADRRIPVGGVHDPADVDAAQAG